jgi:hypothetical protein
MVCNPTSTDRSRAGHTLVELVVASTLSALVLLAVVLMIAYISQGTAAVGNHVVMEAKSQNAADVLSQSIRGVRQLSAYTSNSLSFQDFDFNTLQVVYDPSAQTLSLVKTNATTVLLSCCASLRFRLMQENIAAGTFDATNTTTSVTNCKMVLLNWTCSTNTTTAQSSNTNKESLQCAKIVFRNH